MTILSFVDDDTETVFRDGRSLRFGNILSATLRKLDMLEAATTLKDLRWPPGNRLEALKGNRAGQYSIRINDQFRICFVWTVGGPADVGIVDYH